MRRSVRLFLAGGIAVPAVALTTAAVADSAVEGYTRQRVTTASAAQDGAPTGYLRAFSTLGVVTVMNTSRLRDVLADLP